MAAAATACALGGALATPAHALPPIRHVFVIVLENESASATFASNSPAPYLAKTLVSQGAFVPNYYGIGHVSLDNYIAMISGQAPNGETQSDCQFYNDFQPGVASSDGQVVGQGCVYPAAVKTLPDQLDAAGLTWRGYMEDMGNDPARDSGTTCAHPALNTQDQTQTASSTDQYATRHNPFVYFHSIIDTQSRCNADVVPFSHLASDLSSAATTPSFVFITPDLCSDGHDATCADGGPGGFSGINGFLSAQVPKIVNSPAFQEGGLLAIVFDEAATSDASACCGEQSGPNTPAPGDSGPGGGVTGAVLLSQFIAPGTVTQTAYNHYSFLRSYEDIFGVSHLGYAGAAGLTPLGADVFTAPAGRPITPATVAPTGVAPPAVGAPAYGSPASPQAAGGSLRCASGRAAVVRRGRLLTRRVAGRIQILRAHGRPRLRLSALHAAGVSIIAGRGRGRRVGPRRLVACLRYSVALPGRHGRIRIRLSVGRARGVLSARY